MTGPPAGPGDRPVPGDELAAAYRLLIADVYELAGESRRTSEALAANLGQTVARWHLLSVISDGPRSVASAARRLGLARQSVQRVADRLLGEGLAVAEADPADARAPRLALTPEGRRVLGGLVERSDAARSAELAGADVTLTDLHAARRVVRELRRALAG
ncbi:MAG TPA: MarR family transcriptional regulator [Acidimicrobiales bacterium]